MSAHVESGKFVDNFAFIYSIRGHCLEDYVYNYYSVSKFKVAYASVIRPMSDKSQWIKHDPGFKVYPPKTKRPPGRPRKERIHDFHF
jgi:hypothetical protein